MPIHSSDTNWILETAKTAYAFGLNEAGLLVHRYWGARLPNLSDYPPPANPMGWASFNSAAQLTPEEYACNNDIKFIEPAIKVTFADGVRDVVLRFNA